MLSERDIEKLIQPFVNRQEQITDYVIQLIAKRVKEIGQLKPSDVYKLERLLKSGEDVRRINSELSRLTNLQQKDIKNLIRDVAKDAYLDTKSFFDYRHKKFIPFDKNEPLQRVIRAVSKQTSDTYTNLSRSRAFMIRDLKNPKKLVPTSLSKAYYSVIDEAVQASQNGVVDYGTAMRRTLQQLSNSGIRTVEYHPESGKTYTQSLEAAAKRNILDGIRQINQGVQDELGKQYGADGKEITVHEHSAPDHEPIQGHQFTNEEYDKLQSEQPFKDVNGRKFDAIERAIGEYNCRHFTYSIIIGVNKPNFTQAQLDANIARNHKGFTDSRGKHLTLYECTQKQREMERKIRQSKRDIMTAEAAGDTVMLDRVKAQLSQRQKEYTLFSSQSGLSKKPLNLKVQGFERRKR